MGRFWHGFSMVLRMFAQNRDFVKIVVFPLENCYFQGFELAKIKQKSIKNPCKFRMGKENQKNAQEMDLGRSWASFGKGLGRSGASFGRSWTLLGHFGGVQHRAFVKH